MEKDSNNRPIFALNHWWDLIGVLGIAIALVYLIVNGIIAIVDEISSWPWYIFVILGVCLLLTINWISHDFGRREY